MSEANIEVVARLYPGPIDVVTAVAQPDALRSALEPFVHPDFETVAPPGQVPFGGLKVDNRSRPAVFGIDGFVAAYREWFSAWETWVAMPTDFVDVDETRVLVLLDIRARSKTHQVEMPFASANLVTLRNGKVSRLELFFDRAGFPSIGEFPHASHG